MIKNALKLISANLVLAILTFFSIPIIFYHLGLQEYVAVGLFTSLFAISGLLDFGIPSAALSVASTFHEKNTFTYRMEILTLETMTLTLFITLALILALSVHLFLPYWTTQNIEVKNLNLSLSLIILTICLRFLENFYRSVLLGFQRYTYVATNMTIANACRALFGVLAVVAIPTATSYLFVQLTVSLATLILFYYPYCRLTEKKLFTFKLSAVAFAKVKKYSITMFFISASALIITQYDKFYISTINIQNYAIVMIVWNLSSALFLIFAPLGNVALQNLSASKGAEHEYASVLQILKVYLLACFIFIIMSVIFCNILEFFFPELNDDIYKQLALLMFAGAIANGYASFYYQLLILKRKLLINLYLNIVICVIIYFNIDTLYQEFGILSLGWIWLCTNIAYTLIIPPVAILQNYNIHFLKHLLNDVGISKLLFLLCLSAFLFYPINSLLFNIWMLSISVLGIVLLLNKLDLRSLFHGI